MKKLYLEYEIIYDGSLIEDIDCQHDYLVIEENEEEQILRCGKCKYLSIGWFRC